MKRRMQTGQPLIRRPRAYRYHLFRLFGEALEDRTLLATMDWTNTAGGLWSAATNWVNAANPSDHHVPTSSDNAVVDVPGNVTVTYQGSQPTVLTLQNDDTIWVNGSAAGGNATLSVSQSITNDGTILMESSNGGYSDTISTGSGTLTNDSDGIIQVTNGSGGPRTITGTLNNQGQIEVDTASYLTITGAYNAAGGSITGPGYVYNSSLYITASPATATTIPLEGTGDVLETDNLPNTTLWVQGNGFVGNATLTVAAGLTNDGTILLESQNGGYADTLTTGSATFTNDSDGTIHAGTGAGGPRTITGTLVNQGAIDVDSGSYLTITGNYYAAGGSIAGPGYLYNADLYVTVSTTSPTTILLDGTGDVLETANLPNTTLWVQGNGLINQNAALNIPNGLTNDGTILLESINGGYADTLTLAGSFTNDADGVIEATANTGGPRAINGTLVNEGQIEVDTASYLTITGAYNAAGGSITGPGYVYNSSLYITASPATATTIPLEGTGDVLETDNLPNTTLWVQGNGFVGNATLTVAAGLTNDGTILLESQNGGYADTLTTGSATFTNDSDGTIHAGTGAGGPRTITGTLVNQGAIDVDSGSYLTITGNYYAAGGSISGPGYLYNCHFIRDC